MLLQMLKIGLLVYLGFGLYLYLAQRTFMYFPVPERDSHEFAAEYLDCGDVRLKLWVVNPGQARALVYFGGNAEDVLYSARDLAAAAPGHTTYLVNYRGYGGSSGAPTQAGLFADALCIHDALAARHAAIDVLGRSLGSAVAVYLASERPLGRLLLATPHDSAVAIGRRLYPVYPVGLLLKDPYPSVEFAPRVSAPTLLLIAEHDRIVPPEHSQRLAEAFQPGVARSVVIPGAGHNDLSGYAGYWGAIGGFLRGDDG
jgi:pimeloyl-ACP methyl ester carboxylesterase